jgi:hypothetical protein
MLLLIRYAREGAFRSGPVWIMMTFMTLLVLGIEALFGGLLMVSHKCPEEWLKQRRVGAET